MIFHSWLNRFLAFNCSLLHVCKIKYMYLPTGLKSSAMDYRYLMVFAENTTMHLQNSLTLKLLNPKAVDLAIAIVLITN